MLKTLVVLLTGLAAFVTIVVFVTGETRLSGAVRWLTGQPAQPTESSLAEEEKAKREQLERELAAEKERARTVEAQHNAEESARREQAERDLAIQHTRIENQPPATEPKQPVDVPKPPTPLPEGSRPHVNVTNIAAQHNVDVSGQEGMAIHVQVSAEGLPGRHLYVAAYFFSGSGSPIADTRRSLRSHNGQVSTGKTLLLQEPRETDTVTLAIPYSELHVPPHAHSDLEYKVVVFDRDAVEGQVALYNSGPKYFSLN